MHYKEWRKVTAVDGTLPQQLPVEVLRTSQPCVYACLGLRVSVNNGYADAKKAAVQFARKILSEAIADLPEEA